MREEKPLFILAGNGPYENRGCEAIVRGTVKIIRNYFKDPTFVCLSNFNSEKQYVNQCHQEFDQDITHLSSLRLSKERVLKEIWKRKVRIYAYRAIFHREFLKYEIYQDMLPYLERSTAVLSIGGDNYSLDYGIPTLYTQLDEVVIERNKFFAIWGASIGPFSKNPSYETLMINHLRSVNRIFARESATEEYLTRLGIVSNVYSTADPAFLMDSEKPEGIEDLIPVNAESIGLNISPLMANYVTHGDMSSWIVIARKIVQSIIDNFDLPLFLIPHVTIPNSNDYEFMKRVCSNIQGKDKKFFLIPPVYNALETKWIIGRMTLFCGARTHATIASLSSKVPTLTFAYSNKARGINRDIFGNNDYCIEPVDLNERIISDRISTMLDNELKIRDYLQSKIPQVEQSALNSGLLLKQLLSE